MPRSVHSFVVPAARGGSSDQAAALRSTNCRAAFHDIGKIWVWTEEQFGHAAALRYEALIDQAIVDLAEAPARPAAKERVDLLPGVWFYHLAFSRSHVPVEQAVKSPRHFVMFRHLQPGVIEIVRILHDSRDLVRHLPAESKAE